MAAAAAGVNIFSMLLPNILGVAKVELCIQLHSTCVAKLNSFHSSLHIFSVTDQTYCMDLILFLSVFMPTYSVAQ